MPFADFGTNLPELERRFDDEVTSNEYLRAEVAGRVPLPEARRRSVLLGLRARAGAVREGPEPDLGDLGNDIAQYEKAAEDLVPGYLRVLGQATPDLATQDPRRVRPAESRAAYGHRRGRQTYVGGPRPGYCGRARGQKKLLIAGCADVRGEDRRRARLRPVDDGGAEALQIFVSDVIKSVAVVKMDGLKSYDGLDAVYKQPRPSARTPSHAEKLLRNVRRVFVTLQARHSRKWAQYCKEFAFPFNPAQPDWHTHLSGRHQARRPAGTRIHILARPTDDEAIVAA